MALNDTRFIISKDYCNAITDGTHDSPRKVDSGRYLITSKHIKGREIDFASAYHISEEDYIAINKRSFVSKWDVIISMIGEYCGYCHIVDADNIEYAIKNVGLFKTGDEVKAQWLYYYLQSPVGKAYLNKIKSGSSQPYLTLGGIRNLPILKMSNVNSLNVLSSIDKKIDLNNQINKELESMAKLIYDYWFVQFDFPISKEQAEAMGDDSLEGRPYKSSGGKMVWSDELKREIPEGWGVGRISSTIEVKDGTHDSPKKASTGYKLITSKHLKRSGIDFDSAYFISTDDYIQVNKRSNVHSKDILISMIGTIGETYYVQNEDTNFAIKNVGLFKTSQNEKFADFVYLTLISNYGKEYFLSNISGSIQKYLSLGVLRKFPLLQFEDNYLESFNRMVKPILAKMHNNNKENQELASLRDWLLPMLMNGQVKVGK